LPFFHNAARVSALNLMLASKQPPMSETGAAQLKPDVAVVTVYLKDTSESGRSPSPK
jgi:hypothetical protein